MALPTQLPVSQRAGQEDPFSVYSSEGFVGTNSIRTCEDQVRNQKPKRHVDTFIIKQISEKWGLRLVQAV